MIAWLDEASPRTSGAESHEKGEELGSEEQSASKVEGPAITLSPLGLAGMAPLEGEDTGSKE
jgi:hypothetical protein